MGLQHEQNIQKNLDEPVLAEVRKKTEELQERIEKRTGQRPAYDDAQAQLFKQDRDLHARWRAASYR